MYKKRAIFIILFLFILASCSTKDIVPSTAPWIGGTQGLELEFLENAPPEDVFDGGDFPFDVVVKVENKGEWFVPTGDIVLTIDGVRPEEFGKVISELTTHPEENIAAKRKDSEGNIIASTPVFVEFQGFNHISPIVGIAQPFPFRARACYEYGTTANSLLCVRKDLMTSKEGVCEVNENKKVYNSGAPVQFSDLTESRRAANKIGFTLKVSHVGSGDLFKSGVACDFRQRGNLDKIYLVVDTAMNGLTCSGLDASEGTKVTGHVTLYGGEKVISCTQEITSPSDYEFPVILEAHYTYLNGVETEVVVKHTEI